MNIKESIKILGQAAGELSAFIACHNLSMKHKISATDLDEPDYMDMQTCHELQVIAKEMESLPEWISVEDRLPPKADDSTDWSVRVLLYIQDGDYNDMCTGPILLSLPLSAGLVTHWMTLPEPPNDDEDPNAATLDLEEMAKNDKKLAVRLHHQEEAEQGEL